VPFRIRLTSRNAYEIQRPETVRLSEYAATLGTPDPAEPGGFRWRATLALEHVVCIEPILTDEPLTVRACKN
jgi:hypothetical protein